jgi:hypothetical protein
MTHETFRTLIFRLAAPTGCGYARIDAAHMDVPDTAPVRTYRVTLYGATPATFYRPDFEKVGATNFRHNAARQTITFDLDVDAPWNVAEKKDPLRDQAENHPTVRALCTAIGGRVEVVEPHPHKINHAESLE